MQQRMLQENGEIFNGVCNYLIYASKSHLAKRGAVYRNLVQCVYLDCSREQRSMLLH